MAEQQLAVITEVFDIASRRYSRLAPDGLKWGREKEFARTLITANPKLQKATPESLAGAILQTASMGLTLNPATQHCYLIPRGETRGSDVQIAHATPSYRGLIQIAIDGGMVSRVGADVIFVDDKYEDRGAFEVPIHRPARGQGARRKEQDACGVYCVAFLVDGGVLREYMDRDQVMAVRNKSEFKNSALWTTYFTEGYKKAVIRRAQKTWPKRTERFNNAVQILDTYEGNTFEGTATEITEIECIDNQQLQSFKTLLTKAGFPEGKHARQLGLLATSQSVDSIDLLPKDRYEIVFDVLKGHLEQYKTGKEVEK